jgi:transcriptional regulator with XRE-family HTH domain
MTQRDFDYVAAEIEKKSGILISGTTIKRLASGDFSKLPQVATLNAIANYFDYKTWQDFKASRLKADEIIKPEEKPLSSNGDTTRLKSSGRKLIYFIAALLILSVIAAFYFSKPKHHSISNAEKASFSCQRTSANEIPNTVIFKYDIDEVKADSFFIQQSWDNNRRKRIYKGSIPLPISITNPVTI